MNQYRYYGPQPTMQWQNSYRISKSSKMPLGCGMTICKYILCFFNFLIFVTGGVVLGVGIWIAADKSSVLTILKVSDAVADSPDVKNVTSSTVLESVAYVLIAAGAVIFILGFLGCCGAMQESKCMLGTYAVLLFLIFGLEVGAGIYLAVSKGEFEKELKTIMLKSIKSYKPKDKEDGITVAWNYVFAELGCCGVNSGLDLKESKAWSETGQMVPKACCVLKGDKSNFEPLIPGCGTNTIIGDVTSPLTSYYSKGCYEPVLEWINLHMTIVIGVALGIAGIQLLAIIFACCLCSSMNNGFK